jgi:hypothetical protein
LAFPWTASGAFFRGHEEGHEEDNFVLVHRLYSDMYQEQLAQMDRAFDASRIPAIADSPFIRRLFDVGDSMGFARYSFSEYGEKTLPQAIHDGAAIAEIDVILANLTSALETIQSAGVIHGDVHTRNVLCVGGTWKLADLGSIVEIGAKIITKPPEPRFFPAGTTAETHAHPLLDWHGLAEIEREIKTRSPATGT